MTEQKGIEIKEAVLSVKSEGIKTPVEAGKALSQKLGKKAQDTAEQTKAVKQRAVVEWGKRAVIERKPVEKQKAWERRKYMRDFRVEHPDLNTVTHVTSHTTAQIVERAVEFMQKLYLQRNPPSALFTSTELSDAMNTYGPARGDVIRNAMRKLEKQGKVKIHKDDRNPKQPRYKFELLELPQVPQKATA